MSHVNPSLDRIRRLLADAKTIAIVGASSNPEKASHGIMQRLQRVGYTVIPVNPKETEVLGARAYASLADIPVPVDIVDVFRRSEDTPQIADEAVAIGAKALWLQSGIWSDEAAARAAAAGLLVVMDACLATEHALLGVTATRTEPSHSTGGG
jgi:predicted CoA-binding protein